MPEDQDDQRISRRKALKRMGAAGALVWTVPAIQSIGMPKAFAAVGSAPPPPPGCGNARVSGGGGCGLPNFNANAGCGGQSCLTGADPTAPSGCGGIASSTANLGADWVICLNPGCTLQSLSMASGGACWSAPGAPNCTSGALTNPQWSGFTQSGNCVTIHRPTAQNASGQTVTQNISHVDLVICCGD
jgi:hypothetical protein